MIKAIDASRVAYRQPALELGQWVRRALRHALRHDGLAERPARARHCGLYQPRPKQPCRGLSVRSARRFRPLYGSIGVSGFDEDAIRERDIVVATPEKLDFPLRNDSSPSR